MEADRIQEIVGQKGAHHVYRAVGEVEDLHDAEEQRQSQGHEEVDGTRRQADRQALNEAIDAHESTLV